jgi:hypothetical protein
LAIDVVVPSAGGGSATDSGRREVVVDVPSSAEHREIGGGVHDTLSGLATYRRLRVPQDADRGR